MNRIAMQVNERLPAPTGPTRLTDVDPGNLLKTSVHYCTRAFRAVGILSQAQGTAASRECLELCFLGARQGSATQANRWLCHRGSPQ